MNAKASSFFAGGIIVLTGTLGNALGHLPTDRFIVMVITVIGMLALAGVLGKFK